MAERSANHRLDSIDRFRSFKYCFFFLFVRRCRRNRSNLSFSGTEGLVAFRGFSFVYFQRVSRRISGAVKVAGTRKTKNGRNRVAISSAMIDDGVGGGVARLWFHFASSRWTGFLCEKKRTEAPRIFPFEPIRFVDGISRIERIENRSAADEQVRWLVTSPVLHVKNNRTCHFFPSLSLSLAHSSSVHDTWRRLFIGGVDVTFSPLPAAIPAGFGLVFCKKKTLFHFISLLLFSAPQRFFLLFIALALYGGRQKANPSGNESGWKK